MFFSTKKQQNQDLSYHNLAWTSSWTFQSRTAIPNWPRFSMHKYLIYAAFSKSTHNYWRKNNPTNQKTSVKRFQLGTVMLKDCCQQEDDTKEHWPETKYTVRILNIILNWKFNSEIQFESLSSVLESWIRSLTLFHLFLYHIIARKWIILCFDYHNNMDCFPVVWVHYCPTLVF